MCGEPSRGKIERQITEGENILAMSIINEGPIFEIHSWNQQEKNSLRYRKFAWEKTLKANNDGLKIICNFEDTFLKQ